MKPDYTISDTICLWLSSGRKIGSKKLRQALNLAKKASIFRPFFKEIDYQTLTGGSHPALFIKKEVLWPGLEPKTLLLKEQDFTIQPWAISWFWVKKYLTEDFSGLVQVEKLDPKCSSKPFTLPRRHSSSSLSHCVNKLTIKHSPADLIQLFSW